MYIKFTTLLSISLRCRALWAVCNYTIKYIEKHLQTKKLSKMFCSGKLGIRSDLCFDNPPFKYVFIVCTLSFNHYWMRHMNIRTWSKNIYNFFGGGGSSKLCNIGRWESPHSIIILIHFLNIIMRTWRYGWIWFSAN